MMMIYVVQFEIIFLSNKKQVPNKLYYISQPQESKSLQQIPERIPQKNQLFQYSNPNIANIIQGKSGGPINVAGD